MQVSNHYTPKCETESILRESVSLTYKTDLVIPKGTDLLGICHPDLARVIKFPRSCTLAVVQISKYLTGYYCSEDGYTTHKTLPKALQQLRRLLLNRKVAYAIDKLGNVYALRTERLHFVGNVLNKGEHNA